MTIQDLIVSLPSGLWKHDLVQLKAKVDGISVSRRERKWLENEILAVQKAAKRGKLLNLLTLALALDQEGWGEWIRKSPVLRASKYALNPSIPAFLCSALLECADPLSLHAGFREYLGSTQNLLKAAESFGALQSAVVRDLFAEKERVLKSALAFVELTFLARSEFGTLQTGGLISEEMADGLSYLVYLYASRVGQARGAFGGIDPRCVTTDKYLKLIVDAHTLSEYGQWEFLVGHFGYRCGFDASTKTLRIDAPTRDFAKSLRLGYVSTFVQRLAMADRSDAEKMVSLRDVGTRLSEVLEKLDLITLKEEPVRRWVFGIPEVDPLQKLLQDERLFREEFENLERLSRELISSSEEIESFSINGVRMHDLLRAQRFANVLRLIFAQFFAGRLKEEPETVAQSLIPVFDKPALLKFIAYGAGQASAERILDSLTWKEEGKRVFDIMYQPIIEVEQGWFMVPLQILGVSDLVRNSMQLFQKRMSDGKNDILSERLAQVLNHASWTAKSDVTYKYGGLQGDLGVIAIQGDALFVFECKNSLHPCSTAELRTSLDHILHSQEQLDRFRMLWEQQGFREYLSKRLGWKVNGVSSVTTCVVTGNRMFNGMRLG
jgi:hypothetical protein